MAQAFVAHAFNRGFTPGAIEDLLLDRRNELSAWVYVHRRQGRQRSDVDARRRVQTSITNSVANPRSPNYRPAIGGQSEAKQLVGEWLGLIEALVWNARRQSLLSVLAYIGQIATKVGSVQVTVSSRQLAEHCGIGQKTAVRALHKAREEGWLHLIEDGRTREHEAGTPYLLAPRYRITLPPEAIIRPLYLDAKGDSVDTDELRVRRTESLLAHHDAFAWRALGKSAYRIYTLLDQEHLTRAQLLAMTGFHRDTVKRALHRLVEAELVAEASDAYYLIAHDLDAVAELHGTAGLGERRREQHQWERMTSTIQLDQQRVERWRVRRRARIVLLVSRALGEDCVVPDTAELIWDAGRQLVIDLESGEVLCAA